MIVFIIPLIQLIIWNLQLNNLISFENLNLLFNSVTLGVLASVLTVFFGITLALSYRDEKKLRFTIDLATSGYAIPGSVLAAGLLVSFGYFFNISITSLSLIHI